MALFVGTDGLPDNVLPWPGYVCESGNVRILLEAKGLQWAGEFV